MKKSSICLFIMLLLLPIFVFADLSAPEYNNVKAYISNSDGAYLYKYDNNKSLMMRSDIHLNFNTDVTITKEMKISDELYYGELYYGNECSKRYEGLTGGYDCTKYYVNLTNVSVHNLDVDYTTENLETDLRKLYSKNKDVDISMINSNNIHIIIADNNVPLYYGPSIKYDKKVKSLDLYEEYEVKVEYGSWYYITNEKNSGWVNSSYGIATKTFYDEYWFIESTPLYSTPSLDKILKSNMAKDTKATGVYSYKNDYEWLIIYYNDGYYCVNADNSVYAVSYDETKILNEDVKTYKELYAKTFDTIKKNTKIKILYRFISDKEIWYYINYNESYYSWISYPITDNTTDNKEDDNEIDKNIFIVENVDTYDTIEGRINGKISSNTVVEYLIMSEEVITDPETKKSQKRTYYYVKYDNKYYWIYGSSIMNNTSKSGSVIAVTDTDLYDSVGGNKISVMTANTIANFSFSYKKEVGENSFVKYYYVEFNDRNYWIDDKTIAESKGKAAVTVKLASDQPLFNKPGGVKGRIAVPRNTKFVCEYIYTVGAINWFYIDNNSYKGWINDSNGSSVETEDPFGVLEKVNFEPQAKSNNGIVKIILGVVALLVLGGAGAFFVIRKKKKGSVGTENSTNVENAPEVSTQGAENVPPMSENIPPMSENVPPMSENVPPMSENVPPMSENVPPMTENIPPMTENVNIVQNDNAVVTDNGKTVATGEIRSIDEASELIFEDLSEKDGMK